MRICLCVSELFSSKVENIAVSEFQSINFTFLPYKNYKDVPTLIRDRQREFDAIIFGGTAPMQYCEVTIPKETIWKCIPRDGSVILRALLDISVKGYDINQISIDTYSERLIKTIYSELGINVDKTGVKVLPTGIVDEFTDENALSFHLKNFHSGQSVVCLTALVGVHHSLSDRKIPNFFASPTYNVVRETITHTHEVFNAMAQCTNPMAVVVVSIDTPTIGYLAEEHGYQFVQEKLKITQKIYLLAEELKAGVVDYSPRDYILYSSSSAVEAETRHFRVLDLLDWIDQATPQTVSVGIGVGMNVNLAQRNALRAVEKAKAVPGNSAFVLSNDNTFVGPILPKAVTSTDAKTGLISRIQSIADKAGISFNIAYQLHTLVGEQKSGVLSTADLARALNISRRTASGYIEKLEKAGIASYLGKRMVSDKGRPTMFFKINL